MSVGLVSWFGFVSQAQTSLCDIILNLLLSIGPVELVLNHCCCPVYTLVNNLTVEFPSYCAFKLFWKHQLTPAYCFSVHHSTLINI